MRRIVLPLIILSASLVAACAGGAGQANKTGGAAPGNDGQLTVRSNDQMRFEPANATVRVNTPVQLVLDNSGSALVHDWTVDNLGGQRFQVVAQPNQRANGTFTAASAGSLQIYCSQPGHREAGMTGTLTVN